MPTPDDIMPRPSTPTEAWDALVEGNARFVADEHSHPRQDADRRAALVDGQAPFVAVLGCSDSRVPAEIVFDQGIGDLFVVRTAGQATDPAVLGSVEYGVEHLGVPLVVVLGHERCGAVAAAVASVASGTRPEGFVRDVVERVVPSVLAAADGDTPATAAEVEHVHVAATVDLLMERSEVLSEAVAEGRCAVVGAVYQLDGGAVQVVTATGAVDLEV